MSASATKKVIGTAAGGIGTAGAILLFLNTIYSEVKEMRHDVLQVSERLARIEGRQSRIIDYTEWRDGDTERLAEVKKDEP